jgi:hypothetical protein
MSERPDPEAVMELARSEEFRELTGADEMTMSDLVEMIDESGLEGASAHAFGWTGYLFVTPTAAGNDPAPYEPVAAPSESDEVQDRLREFVETPTEDE